MDVIIHVVDITTEHIKSSLCFSGACTPVSFW